MPTLQIPRPKGNHKLEGVREWVPYPLARPPVLEYFDTRFDHLCDLCIISNEVLSYLSNHRRSQRALADLWREVLQINHRVVTWLQNLPLSLRATNAAASHVLTLKSVLP